MMGTIANYLPPISGERRSEVVFDFSLFGEFDIYPILSLTPLIVSSNISVSKYFEESR